MTISAPVIYVRLRVLRPSSAIQHTILRVKPLQFETNALLDLSLTNKMAQVSDIIVVSQAVSAARSIIPLALILEISTQPYTFLHHVWKAAESIPTDLTVVSVVNTAVNTLITQKFINTFPNSGDVKGLFFLKN